MSPRFPSYERCDKSPPVSDDFQGITIAVPAAVDLSKEPRLPVFGAFQLPDEMAAKIPGSDPFRAIVLLLVAANGYHPFCFNVSGRAILLERSAAAAGKFRGYFNVDAFQMARIQPRPGRYFVSVYLDKFQATPLPIVVTGEPPSRS